MDARSLSTETFSYSRLTTRRWRQLYAHRLQWFRGVLSLAATFNTTCNIGKLYWHYSTHHTPSVLPDFLAFSLSVAARSSWIFLFRDPAAFFRFKRPGRAYRWMVCGTVVLTTLPNSLVHIWALKMALKNDTIVLAGVVQAILAIVFLIPIIGLVWWMAWRFLLGLSESDEEFEPIVKPSMTVTGGERQFLAPAVEPYTDDVSIPPTGTGVVNGYLSQAYEEQRLRAHEPPPDRSSAGYIETPQLEEAQNEESEELERPLNEAPNAIPPTDVANPPRCQTISRFEYVPQSHRGPHSWLSYPIIPLVLSIYATMLLIGLPIWIHEDRQYKLRPPSSTIKKSLYLPLGIYLLSFYALKHHLRASLFERFDIMPPEPWKKMLSILPSWVGTGGTFKNMDTGEITVYDPRRRAFPWRAYRQPAIIRTREYHAAYNASTGGCTMYWGHSGRSVRNGFRMRPTIHRIGFLLLAMYIMWKGFWNTVFYNVPNVYEEILKHPKTIKAEDVARIFRILRFWQAFVFSGLWFTLLALIFAVACMGSTLVLFLRAVWRYVPQEEKERIIREARERIRERNGPDSSDGSVPRT